jgi:teichoic acid transport system permease protein
VASPALAPSSASAWLPYLRELWRRREFSLYLALANLKARNASTALGLFWWVLNPLLLGGVYLLVFGVIFEARRSHPAYLAYLLSGIFVFYYTRAAMLGSSTSILSNAKLLANLRFPRLVLPLAALIEALVGFGASILVYFLVAFLAHGIYPQAWVAWLVPAVAIHTLFNFGLGALTARVTVPFRDVTNLVPYVVRLWLYLSPIIYTLDRVPAGLRPYLELNPLVPFLAIYRAGLLGEAVTAGAVALAVGWALVVAALGVALFVRYEGRMVRYL